MSAVENIQELTSLCDVFGRGSQQLRAVVVDDSKDYMQVICTLLELDNMVEVVGRASNGADAIQSIAHLRPDVLIMDVQMPLVDGLAAASFLSQHFPETAIILMSSEDSPHLRQASVACGAHAFIYKATFRREIEDVLRSIKERKPRQARPLELISR